MRFFKSKLQIFLSSAIAILAVAAIAGATTIGTNISTDGNITVTGNLGIGTSTPSGQLDIQGDLSIASAGDELLSDSDGAVCSADGDCVTKSASVVSGVDYLVQWDQQHSAGNNGNITPYLGTSAGTPQMVRNGTKLSGGQEVITANTTGTVNLVFTVSAFTSGTITLSNISLKALTPSRPVQRFFNSDGSEAFSIRSGGSSYYNTFFGYGAGRYAYNRATIEGKDNSAFGYKALYNNTVGVHNTAVGKNALLSNTTGYRNSAFGDDALFSNTTGIYNTAIGEETLYYNTTGSNNTAVGLAALAYNTTGVFNVAVGSNALLNNTIGLSNTATGMNALYNNVSGSQNTAVGVSSLYNSTAGANTAFGNQAGYGVTTGTNNTLLGYNAGYSGTNLTTGSNNIIIGFNIGATSTSMTNGLIIGNFIYGTGFNGTGTTLSSGKVGIGTTSPAATLDVEGYMRLKKNTSQPAACSTANAGAIALNSAYLICSCNGASWINAASSTEACVW